MKEVLALWRMELSRVDEQLGMACRSWSLAFPEFFTKKQIQNSHQAPCFLREFPTFQKKATGASAEAIGAITELLMATGRTPAFQAAVEAWLNMYREEGLLCCLWWIPETQKANKFLSTSTSFRKFVRTLSQSFGGQKLQYYFATHVYKVDALCTRSLGIVHSSCTSWTQAFGRSTATCRKLLLHQTLTLELYLFVQVKSGEFFQAAQLSNSNRKVLPFPSYHWTLVHSSFSSMSKGQWGNREYYDAATATSPAAAAVRHVKFGMNMDGCFDFFSCFLPTLVEFGHIAWNLLKYFERAKRFIGTGVWTDSWNDKTSSKICFARRWPGPCILGPLGWCFTRLCES